MNTRSLFLLIPQNQGTDFLRIHSPINAMVILYHGTGSASLESILQEGLQPRSKTGVPSHWKEYPSKPEFVYLTSTYPVYFAMAVAGEKDKPVVLKVEVDENQLYPDEDFLAQFASMQLGVALRDLPIDYHPSDFKDLWRYALDGSGLVCTPQVNPESILDYKVLDDIGLAMQIGGDATPHYLNYAVMGNYYQGCVKALFDGGEAEAWKAVEELRNGKLLR